MPVRIVRSKGATAALAAPKAAPAPTKPAGKSLKVGKSEIRSEMDLREEQGKNKFLVHKRKPGIWYRVRSHDPQTGALKLSTVHDKGIFPSSTGRAMIDNYVLVVEAHTEQAPSDAAIARVQKEAK